QLPRAGRSPAPARGALTLPEAGHSLTRDRFTWRAVAVHNYVIPQSVKDRVIRRQGKLLSHDTIDAARTALVVVDMQNYFVAEGFAAEVPAARGIVPNINRMAKSLRAAGGTVLWVQTTATGALEHWANHHKHMLTTDRVDRRLKELNES